MHLIAAKASAGHPAGTVVWWWLLERRDGAVGVDLDDGRSIE